MELSITGEFAKQLFERSKTDEKLAQALAKEFLGSIDPAHMAEFLLQSDIAVALLAARLQRDPRGTIQQLQRLPKAQPGSSTGRSRRPTRGRTLAAAQPAMRRQAGRKQSRRRLTATQVAALKKQVRAYLASHPWATRKELTARIDLPTQALYRRIMVELQESGEVIVRGQKAKATYALKGAKVTNRGAVRAKAAPKRGRPKKTKTKTGTGTKTGTKTSEQRTGQKIRVKRVANKSTTKATRKKRTPVSCPVPGCSNLGAPIFGMLCKAHKDIAPEEREKLFADRRHKR